MLTVTKQKPPSFLRFDIPACCICEMQISGWWQITVQSTQRVRQITRDVGENPCSLSFNPLSLHSSLYLSTLHRSLLWSRISQSKQVTLARTLPGSVQHQQRPERWEWESNGTDCRQFKRTVSLSSFPLSPLYLHGAHMSTWSKASILAGEAESKEKEVDTGVCSVGGDKGTHCFNSGAGPGTNWIW